MSIDRLFCPGISAEEARLLWEQEAVGSNPTSPTKMSDPKQDNSTLVLPQNPTLKECQVYLARMVRERGFSHETAQETLLLLTEEIGELAKAVRKHTGMATDSASETFHIADEIADVFLVLGCLANLLGIDLEDAVRVKEAKNSQRQWISANDGSVPSHSP